VSRPNEGWSVGDPRTPGGVRTVRFSFNKRQCEISTGERGYTEACAAAARLVPEYIARGGPAPKVGGKKLHPDALLGPIAADWVDSLAPTALNEAFALQIVAHIVPWFRTLDRLTPELCPEYYTHRLGQVQRSTVTKEVTCLRAFVEWLHGKGLTSVKPDDLPAVPKRDPGTPHKVGKREPQAVEPAELRAILHGLPARCKERRKESGNETLCRLLYALYYETGLRPKTIHSLAVPDNWRKGEDVLRLAAKNDKTKFARAVPISRAARLILHWLTEGGTRRGPIFGRRPDHRDTVKRVAKAVLGERGAHFQFYDLRRAAGTHAINAGAPLTGVAWLLGHKHVSTTSKYIKPGQRAAEQALRARRKSNHAP